VTSTTAAEFDEDLYVPVEVTSTVTDGGTDTHTQCTVYEYVEGTGVYLVLPSVVASYEDACPGETGAILTGKSEVLYDGATSQASNVPTKGLPTTETSYVTASETVTSKATYDSDGRIIAAWMPSVVDDYPDNPSMSWAYSTETDGLWKTSTTNTLEYESSSWVEPTRQTQAAVQQGLVSSGVIPVAYWNWTRGKG
jgi:hypothetical protein